VPVGAPAAGYFAGAYVSAALGGGQRTTILTAAAILVIVTATNMGGVRVSGRVQLGLAGLLVTLLVVATVTALPHAKLANLTPFAPHGWLAVGSAAGLLVWAFAGWEAVTSLSAEYANPARDITRATAIAIGVIAVLYLGIAFATVAVLGSEPGAAPLSDLLVLGFGEWARPVTTVVAVLLSVGAINAYFAGGARLGAALARDGSLPVWLARGSTAGEVPRRALAVITLGGLTSLTVLTVGDLSLNAPLLMTTGAFTLVYVVGTASGLKLLPRGTWVHHGALVGFVSTLVLLGIITSHLF